ncbi:hypothetical protein SteCoe_10056 [Stentor coeruleus]|uniref:Thioredoxin domain-containing protein n=1 Tax=Stentor coeruleus TaxID=5963 RepID=A0A1R2CGC1_9CILI|nr:hypothetical protein SteCoe_10056 [Stentor coeruleus]
MLIFALFLLSFAEVDYVKVQDIDALVKEKKGLKAFAFCDGLMDPCKFFFMSTRNYLAKVRGFVGQVDVSSPEDIEKAREYGLSDYPYIIYYEDSKEYIQYQGSLEPIDIYTNLDRIAMGPIEIPDLNTLLISLDSEYNIDGLLLTINLPNFQSLSSEFLTFFPVAYTTSSEIQDHFSCKTCAIVFRPKILLSNNLNPYTIIKDLVSSSDIISSYYKDLSFLTPNSHIWTIKDKPLLTLYGKFSPREEPTQTRYIVTRINKALSQYYGEFTTALGKIDDFKWILDEMGLGSHRNLSMIDDMENVYVQESIFSTTGTLVTENIVSFVMGYKEKKLKNYVISEPIPEKPYENGVKILVGHTIDETIQNTKEDMVILVYSIYDSNTPSVIVLIEKLAEKMPMLVFGKIEGNRNYVPSGLETYTLPVAYYLKNGYQPQKVDINYEDPTITIKNIQMLYRSSQDL